MAKGNFTIDTSISKDVREKIEEKVSKNLEKMKNEVSKRKTIYNKRHDFFEGRHHKWTNVVGQGIKQQEGHILVVVNYVLKFCQKIIWSLTNQPPKIKIVPEDEANDIEITRAEAVEKAVWDVFKDNKFFPVIYEKLAVNQVRDGDFCLDCRVIDDAGDGKKILLQPNEDLLKVMVGWDDASGTSFSFVAFKDLWTIDKIKREFDYTAEPISEAEESSETQGSHLNDQYGMFANVHGAGDQAVPSGKTQLPKARITDYWGYEIIKGKLKVVNLVYVNHDLVQFVVSDYHTLPKLIGHSLVVAGKPWSMSFIDPLIDPQIELNDRTGEEGDLIRVGSHMKFLVVNMPDFDPNSVKPGSGQVIFLEGEDVDFRPLQMTISPFPSADYINRVLDHLFNLGLPKIALAAGTAPYTGRVAAIQYQPVSDIITNYRIKWEDFFHEMIRLIQQYLIDFFPETHSFMRESLYNSDTGEYSEGDLIIRDIEFDWDNPLPLSRSDKVVDASTLRDRGAISLHTFLEEVGFKDPQKEIKKLKKEAKDKELMVTLQKFNQFAPGAVQAQLEARKEAVQAEEELGETMGGIEEAKGASQPAKPPLLTPEQNEGRRGIMTGTGTPTGQTRGRKGAVAQVGQNINAQAGV